jgi:hypothetical protein
MGARPDPAPDPVPIDEQPRRAAGGHLPVEHFHLAFLIGSRDAFIVSGTNGSRLRRYLHEVVALERGLVIHPGAQL